MSKYDSADVDTTAKTVTFGDEVYSVVGGPETEHSYRVERDGKSVGTFAHIAGGNWVGTDGRDVSLDVIGHVADAWARAMRDEGKLP